MKLTKEQRIKVRTFAKKLSEGSFQVNKYNFKPSISFKEIQKSLTNTINVLQTALDDIEDNMGSKAHIYTRFQSLMHEMDKIQDKVMETLKDYEKEGNGGSYLTKVTDPDTLSKIDKFNKGNKR